MAKTSRRSKEAKCIPIETLTKRLAASFGPVNWPVEAVLCTDTVADHLEIHVENVEALIAAGLLACVKGNLHSVEATEVARFLAANPWWYRVRAEKQLEHLRQELTAIDYRRKRAAQAKRSAARAGITLKGAA